MRIQHKGLSDWPFSIRINILGQRVICPFLRDYFNAPLCNINLHVQVCRVFATMCEVSLRIMGMSVVTLKVLLYFLLKDGPASKSAHDIYPSTVNNQGAGSRGCIFWWCCSHYTIDSLTRQHSVKKPNEIAATKNALN